MLISIIIPAFNAEKTIEKSLNSILTQVRDIDYEIIIVDDGSTDATKEIILPYCASFNVIYLWQVNSKQSVARNHGLKYAKGEYVFFFDADDVVENSMIKKMIHKIKITKSDLVICGIRKIFIDANGHKREVDELHSSLENADYPIESFLVSGKEMDAGLWNKIFKRKVIIDFNLSFENGNFFEDSLFVMKYLLAMTGDIYFIPEPLYSLYKRKGTTTTEYNEDIISYAKDYLNKVNISCNENGGLNGSCEKSFLLRLYLHVFHHHIKYAPVWNVKKMQYLKETFNINSEIVFFNDLSIKYKLAALAVLISPRGYSFIYKKMMA
ncbi:glycosyltransferase family 2 protein [Pectobacterium atrosepticum]|uniref:glycosyltransferase family 2 protein n=1 Tax=Pectobacterium atrosepticum TaxID=29471 RepID=UPI0003A5D4FA|nr:glycosyltransferase family 2 protein [Pectobacterium atrosepticum]